MRMPPLPPEQLLDQHTITRGSAANGHGLYLERAEYVSPDYQRRLVVDFNWFRAAAGERPWGVRRYVRVEHATTPTGIAWRLSRRQQWSQSFRSAVSTHRPWMLGKAAPASQDASEHD